MGIPLRVNINDGWYKFTGAGAGSYNINMSIDFGARKLVTSINGNYELGCTPPSCSSPTNFSFSDTYNFAGDAPAHLAQESFNSAIEPGKFTCGGGTCNDIVSVQLRLRNNVSTGEIAKFGDSTVSVKAPGVGGDAISGSATGVLK